MAADLIHCLRLIWFNVNGIPVTRIWIPRKTKAVNEAISKSIAGLVNPSVSLKAEPMVDQNKMDIIAKV